MMRDNEDMRVTNDVLPAADQSVVENHGQLERRLSVTFKTRLLEQGQRFRVVPLGGDNEINRFRYS